jgi:hypothetical protein
MSRNDECRKHDLKINFPPSLKANNSKAYCLWIFHDGGFKNMGCMEKMTCEYSMRQMPQTVCAKGSLKDKNEIEKIYLAHEKKVKIETDSKMKKTVSKEASILEKGNPKEVVQLVKEKYGRLEITSIGGVASAQKKLEPFCTNNNAEACFVLHELYGLSDFKEEWKRTAQSQCEDLKKSYEFLNRSCVLGYNQACQAVISTDDLDEGRRSNSIFIREPGQNGQGNDEPKGVNCKIPKASADVYNMKDQCSKLDRETEMCIYSRHTNIPLEKMSYEQLVKEGETARSHKMNSEASSYYKKACEIKSGTRPCIDWAIAVYESDIEKGRSIYLDICNDEKTIGDFKSDCNSLFRHFMPGQ